MKIFGLSFDKPAPPAAVFVPAEEPPKRAPVVRISDFLLARLGLERKATPRAQIEKTWQLPSLPPGVLPEREPEGVVLAHDESPRMALDDQGNAPYYAWASQFNAVAMFQGYPYLAQLSQISEYRSPAETISTEMTRKWLRLKTIGKGDKADKLEAIEAALKDFQIREHFKHAALLDNFFGRAQMYVKIKNQTDDMGRQLPLIVDSKTVKKGSLEGFSVIEPYWTTPYSYNSTDPAKADFYKPVAWFVVGKRTHASRLLSFISRPLPDLLKPSYNFGGMSLTQLMEPYVNNWLRTRTSISNLLHSFSISVLGTNLAATLAEDQTGAALFNRAQVFNQLRDNRGLMIIDKDSETLAQVNTPLSGLDALQAQALEQMAGPCHIPLVKLFGITPTGLNASSEGEIKTFYDFIRAMQENVFGPNIDIVLKLIQLHLFGEVDDAIGYEWVKLDEPTTKEAAEERKTDADRDAVYMESGVVSPEEVREKLSSDPNSGYSNLSMDDMPQPPESDGDDDEGAGDLGEEK